MNYIFKEYPDFDEKLPTSFHMHFRLTSDFRLYFDLEKELSMPLNQKCEFLYKIFNQVVDVLVVNLGLSIKVLKCLKAEVDENNALVVSIKENLKQNEEVAVSALLGCFINFHKIPICELQTFDEENVSPCNKLLPPLSPPASETKSEKGEEFEFEQYFEYDDDIPTSPMDTTTPPIYRLVREPNDSTADSDSVKTPSLDSKSTTESIDFKLNKLTFKPPPPPKTFKLT
ncbi:MAG: hypothetical protein ACRYGG_09020, partial [Janthinobacterium lividum]